MNEDEFAALVRWGNALAGSDTSPELRAAGRAVLMLANEVERLHVESWNLRAELRAHEEERDRPSDVGPPEPTFLAQLTRRLHVVLRRD